MGNDFRSMKEYVVDPSGQLDYWWSGVVSIAVLYNLVVIVARAVLSELQTAENVVRWATFDYISDLIYIADMAIKARTGKP